MKLLKQLVKKAWFWLVLVQSLLGIYCLVGAITDYYPAEKWVSLPLLPNGETAKEITETYVHREIHVITDQGHSYGCRYSDEKIYWFPIPREVNRFKSRLPWTFGRQYPPPPPGTRRLVAEKYDYKNYSGSITFAVIIRADGQVAYWDDVGSHGGPLYIGGACWGLYFVFLGCSVFMLLISLRNRQRQREETLSPEKEKFQVLLPKTSKHTWRMY